MLSRAHFEARVLAIIDSVLAGHSVEDDDSVELKGVWVDAPALTARTLAAHANRARGAPILWIIGLDDKHHKITGSDIGEFSNWYAKLTSWFNGPMPYPALHFNAHSNGRMVAAIVFDTGAAPFVVKHPLFGNTKGAPEFEVPWRIGTATHSARREDLLRLLAPLVELPECELIECGLAQQPGGTTSVLLLSADIYVASSSMTKFVIPRHKCSCRFRVDGQPHWVPMMVDFVGQPASPTLQFGETTIVVDGAAMIRINGGIAMSTGAFRKSKLEVAIDIGIATTSKTVAVRTNLVPQRGSVPPAWERPQ